jgi:hypothetical protein
MKFHYPKPDPRRFQEILAQRERFLGREMNYTKGKKSNSTRKGKGDHF